MPIEGMNMTPSSNQIVTRTTENKFTEVSEERRVFRDKKTHFIITQLIMKKF